MKVLIILLAVISISIKCIKGTFTAIPRLPANAFLDGEWPPVDGRIVGGSQASPGEFPYQISLQRFSGTSWSHFCGGSIYNDRTILNAAHCVIGYNANNLRVVAGEYDLLPDDRTEQIRSVVSYVYHPSYNSTTFQYDISILKLSSPLIFGTYVDPVVLPKVQGSRPDDGTNTTIAGWGTTSEGASSLPAIIRQVSIPIVSEKDCSNSYGPNAIKPGMICAGFYSGGADSCQGDSGGPMVIKGTKTQIGIVSWGRGCARPYYYGVYTLVSYYLDWITTNSADPPPSSPSSSTTSKTTITNRISTTTSSSTVMSSTSKKKKTTLKTTDITTTSSTFSTVFSTKSSTLSSTTITSNRPSRFTLPFIGEFTFPSSAPFPSGPYPVLILMLYGLIVIVNVFYIYCLH